MSRTDKQRQAAAHAAATRGKDALHELADKLGPIVDDASEVLVPLALDAKQRIVPLVDGAKGKLRPLALEVRDRITPLAMDAKGSIVPLVDETGVRVGEWVSSARRQIKPVVDDAALRLQRDVVPQVKSFVSDVLASDAVSEAQSRTVAAAAALRGDLRMPVEPTRPRGRWWKLLLGGAAITAIVVAVRQFIAGKDDGWTAHEPSEPYVRPADPDVVVVADSESTPGEATDTEILPTGNTDEATEATDAPSADTDTDSITTEDEPSDDAAVPSDGDNTASPTDTVETADVDDISSPYGEGSYIGSNPPEDYLVKGNRRSMKYHTPETGSYDKTIADVWFSSEETATQAGFTRAQR